MSSNNRLDNILISSTVIFQAISFVLGILKIKVLTSYLDISDFGIYSVLYPTLNVLVTFVVFGSDRFLVRLGETEENFKLLKNMYCYMSCFLLVSLTGSVFIIETLPSTHLIIGLFLLAIAQLNRNSIFAVGKIIPYNWNTFLINNHWLLILIYPIFKISITFDHLIYAMNVGFLIAIIHSFFYIKVKKLIRMKLDFTIMKSAFSYSIPLLPYVFGQALIRMSDRYSILYFLGPESVAYYNVVYTLVATVTTFTSVMLEVFRPKIFKAVSNEEVSFTIKKMLLLIGIFAFPSLIGMIIYGEEIIILLSSSQYIVAKSLIPILSIVPIVTAWTTIAVNLCEREGKNDVVGKAFSWGLCLNIILNLILVYFTGIVGSAIAAILTCLTVFFIIQAKVSFFSYFNMKEQLVCLWINLLFFGCLLIAKACFEIPLLYNIVIGIFLYLGLLFIFARKILREYYF